MHLLQGNSWASEPSAWNSRLEMLDKSVEEGKEGASR